jgi:oligosaccharide repeat unit polymerase
MIYRKSILYKETAYKKNSSNMFLSRACRLLILISSIIISLISITQILGEPVLHDNWAIIVSFLCLSWIGIYMVCSSLEFKSLYLFTSAYIIMLSLFHLGITIPHSLAFIGGLDWLSFGMMAKWYERAGWYTALALGCLGIGFGISLMSLRIRAKPLTTNSQRIGDRLLNTIFWDGFGLLLASSVFLLMAIQSFGDLTSYSRVDFFRTSKDTRGFGVFLMVLPAAVTMLMIGANRHFKKLFAISVASISFIILLLSGYRSSALYPLLIGIIIFVKVGKKIPFHFSVSIIFLVIIIIPIIGMLRGMGPYNKLNLLTIEKSMKNTKAQDTFVELGGTAGVLAHVVRLVPEIDSYRYGTTYIRAFRDSIPNIMPNMSASYRAKSKQEALVDPSAISKMVVPSDWITYRVDRERFNTGEGLGFSAIGEPYINFGIIGVVIYFILLGYFLGRLDGINLLEHPKILVFSCSMLGPLIGTVRGDFGNFVKPAIFITIILGIWRILIRIISPKYV